MSYKKVLEGNIPYHVAIILDGNGRWAKKRGMPRTYGHQQGVKSLIDIARNANEIGIKELTVFAFSTENWNRPQSEVEYLMTAPIEYINEHINRLKESNIKICFVGRKDRFPTPTLDALNKIMFETAQNTGLVLTLCLDYGSYDEITTAVKNIANQVKNKNLDIENITPELIENNLFTKDYPKLDLLIRTSGEIRISNFLLWQLGYAELYFTNTFWPDFNEKELDKAIKDYQSRNRRFGGLNENK